MIEEIREKIESSCYWDARVTALECNYFGDEVKLSFEDDGGECEYHFEGCYNVEVTHSFESPKSIPSKELRLPQIPYFMQNVEVDESVIGGGKYLEFIINLNPIELHIICKSFTIS